MTVSLNPKDSEMRASLCITVVLRMIDKQEVGKSAGLLMYKELFVFRVIRITLNRCTK